LFELLTGSVPFSRELLLSASFTETLRIIKEAEPPRPSVLQPRLPVELDWVVMKCLEKDRSRRYETASALAVDLERYLSDEPVLPGPPSPGYRLMKFLRRHRGPALAASLLLLSLLAGFVGTTVGMVRAVRAQRAEVERAEGERLAKETAEKRLAQ